LKNNGQRSSSPIKSGPPSKKFKWSDIQHTAQQRGITENDVIEKLAKKAGVNVDEFMSMVEHQGE
jgi:protein-disulfide isomerase-like protein with CxxC motif